MKAAPTLDGRIRIDPETDTDRWILRNIIIDARCADTDLTDRLSGIMDEDLMGDWTDFVIPDLQNSFNSQLAQIATDLDGLDEETPVFIEKEHAESWYGGLNQARLALESVYPAEKEDDLDEEGKAARIRSHFYMALQSLILEFLM